ncbi:hypothetical protein MKEN_01081200 [Mycena kentingensis (nom. inval.)]|nr:hypothetical protein MKEN_01081200 [Mycena kentingensis (nom. inval.)]
MTTTMFSSTNSPGYSSFFMSGLLSPPASSDASTHSPDAFDVVPRRGSLPTESSRFESMPDDEDLDLEETAMFYFTLQPRRRDGTEYRSFLSLDLAESQSMRSASLRRKSSARRAPRRRSKEVPFTADLQIPDSPNLLPVHSPVETAPRSPTGTPRSVPSPKLAPMAALPIPPSPPGQSLEVPSPARAPTAVVIQPAPSRTLIARKPSTMTQATRASATTSTVSTRYRRKRRDKALACLEGRRPAIHPAPSDNFMSLSDDEDDELPPVPAQLPTPADLDFDLSLTDDQLIMLIARLEDGDLRSAPFPPAYSAESSREHGNGSPNSKKSSPRKAAAFTSFMDFHNDDDRSSRWSWRSIVEVAT